MANVRFLDQVPVVAYATDGGITKVPRFLYPGETLTIPKNQQMVGYDFYNLGLVIIEQGDLIDIDGTLYLTHGLLQIQTQITNAGLIVNNGVLVISEENQ